MIISRIYDKSHKKLVRHQQTHDRDNQILDGESVGGDFQVFWDTFGALLITQGNGAIAPLALMFWGASSVTFWAPNTSAIL